MSANDSETIASSRDILTFGPPRDSRPIGLTFTCSWWCRRDLRADRASVTVVWYSEPDETGTDVPDWSFEVEDDSPRDASGDSATRLVMHTAANAYLAFAAIPEFFAGLAEAIWPQDCSSLDDVTHLLCRLGAQPRRAPWDEEEQ